MARKAGAAGAEIPGTVLANPHAGDGGGDEHLDEVFEPHHVEACEPRHLATGVRFLRDSSAAFVGVACGDGSVNGRVFVNNAVVGQYPAMVRRRRRHDHRMPRPVSALVAMLRQLRHRRKFDVVVNDTAHRAWAVFVGNGRYGTTMTDLIDRNTISDGLLDVRIVDATGRLARVRVLGAMLLGRLDHTPVVESFTTPSVRIHLHGNSVDVAVDGEVLKTKPPLEVRCHPGALTIVADEPDAPDNADSADDATGQDTSRVGLASPDGSAATQAPAATGHQTPAASPSTPPLSITCVPR